MLYLAYGSNINLCQFKDRCRDADYITKGYLKGYKLVFDGYSTNRQSLVADLRKDDDSCKVPYVLWSVTAEDERKLDKAEGFPIHYRKDKIDVDGYGDVTIYRMTDYKKSLREPCHYVSFNYEEVIRKGYRDFNFDEKILDLALVETGDIQNRPK